MELLISIQEKEICLSLKNGWRMVDFELIEDERNLAERLLIEIDRLLKRNDLTTRDIKKMRVQSDQGENFTTTRIARTVAEAWKIQGYSE